MPDKAVVPTKGLSSEQNFPKRDGIWGKIWETFAKSFGDDGNAIDKSWLSKFNAKEL